MKSKEAIAGYFSWQKLLRKARARANDDDDYFHMAEVLRNIFS
jgi:hypothetical protein